MHQYNQLLNNFNSDFHTKEALLDFIKGHLHERIIENAIKKLPVESLADAIIEIEEAFETLKDLYDTQQATGTKRDTNTAK